MGYYPVRYYKTKMVIGISIMVVVGLVVAWSIYKMVLIHRFIMSL